MKVTVQLLASTIGGVLFMGALLFVRAGMGWCPGCGERDQAAVNPAR